MCDDAFVLFFGSQPISCPNSTFYCVIVHLANLEKVTADTPRDKPRFIRIGIHDYIVAGHQSGVEYINHPNEKGPHNKPNIRMLADYSGKITALRDIKPGEELVMKYNDKT